MIHRLKIAVLRGGPGSDYDTSMKTGSYVLKNITKDKYVVYDVSISRDGSWHLNGAVVKPERFLIGVDMVFNTLGGEYGNGRLQRMLNDFGVPHTSSGPLSSAISSNKALTKQIYQDLGIKTPYYKLVRKSNYSKQSVIDIFREIPAPFVVKPVNQSFSVGVGLAYSLEELINLIEKTLEISESVLVEEFVKGKEIVCGVVKGLRNNPEYVLFPAEVVKGGNILLCSKMKENKDFSFLIPGNLNIEEKENIQQISIRVHKALDLGSYSHSDFIVTLNRGIYILETNFTPVLDEDSLLVKSLEAIGADISEFIEAMIESTRRY